MHKLCLWMVGLLCATSAWGQTAVTYRYWFDGKAEAALQDELPASGKLSIPVDDLSGWYHEISFQVRDNRGLWSSVSTRSFALVPNAATRFADGGQYRYWFDGNIADAVTGTMTEGIIPLTIDADSLQGWYHEISFQVCDHRGLWSSTCTRSFVLVPDAATRFADGGQYRYWFDGNTANTVTGIMTEGVLPLDIPVNDLQGWYHLLQFQVRDKQGLWSAVSTRPFALLPNIADRFKGGQYCYWFDDQKENATTAATTGNTIALEIPMNTLTDGDHVMYVQLKDKTGQWSSVATNAFTLSSHALSIMATGGGTIGYDDQLLRDDVLESDLFDNTSVSLTLTPDEGYAIGSVIVNGTQDVTDQVINGTYTFHIKEASAVVVTFELTDFTKLGDVNNDGRVSVGDLSLTVAYLIGEHPSPFVVRQADANNDDEVNAGDLVRIVDLITGAVERGRHAPRKMDANMPVTNDILSGTLFGNKMDVHLQNEDTYTCFQMALTLPEGTDVRNVQLSALRGAGHQLASGWMEDGRLMVVVYSPENDLLLGSDGPLFTIESAEPIDGEIHVDDIVLVTKTGDVRKFSPFTVSPSTGIASLQQGVGTGKSYDITGRQISSKPKRGIYIIDGRKIIFK